MAGVVRPILSDDRERGTRRVLDAFKVSVVHSIIRSSGMLDDDSQYAEDCYILGDWVNECSISA